MDSTRIVDTDLAGRLIEDENLALLRHGETANPAEYVPRVAIESAYAKIGLDAPAVLRGPTAGCGVRDNNQAAAVSRRRLAEDCRDRPDGE